MITVPKQQFRLICKRLKLFGFRSLKEYYTSDKWRYTKLRMRKSKYKYQCVCCQTTEGLSLHHKSYKTLCEENLSHLIWMCLGCHLKTHERVDRLHKSGSIHKDDLWRCHRRIKGKYKTKKGAEDDRRKDSPIIQKENQ